MTTSLKVADYFDKQHKYVLRAIQALDCSEDFKWRNFAPLTRSYRGQDFLFYELTRDGFMTVMGSPARGLPALRCPDQYWHVTIKKEPDVHP